MGKRFKKVFALSAALALAMLFGLVGCGEKNEGNKDFDGLVAAFTADGYTVETQADDGTYEALGVSKAMVVVKGMDVTGGGVIYECTTEKMASAMAKLAGKSSGKFYIMPSMADNAAQKLFESFFA